MPRRFFNTAGPCNPDWHYMVDPLPRLPEIQGLIETKSYFVIHAPRQTGKTTYLYAMMHKLNAEGVYTALQVNIHPAASGRDVDEAMRIAGVCINEQAAGFLPPGEMPPDHRTFSWQVENGLKSYLTLWARTCPKPIALFIDEADSLLDDLFLALLRQLRAGFEARLTAFPQSICLVGLRDVRDYKIRIRPDSASLGTGSPFNIKTDSLFMDMFSEADVNTLMDQHQQETGQVFSPEVRAEVFRLTQGPALAEQCPPTPSCRENPAQRRDTLHHPGPRDPGTGALYPETGHAPGQSGGQAAGRAGASVGSGHHQRRDSGI